MGVNVNRGAIERDAKWIPDNDVFFTIALRALTNHHARLVFQLQLMNCMSTKA